MGVFPEGNVGSLWGGGGDGTVLGTIMRETRISHTQDIPMCSLGAVGVTVYTVHIYGGGGGGRVNTYMCTAHYFSYIFIIYMHASKFSVHY